MGLFAPCRLIARVAMILCCMGASTSLLAYSQAPHRPHARACCTGLTAKRRPGSHPVAITKPRRHAARPTTRFKPRGVSRSDAF